jgi:hypothetical protein
LHQNSACQPGCRAKKSRPFDESATGSEPPLAARFVTNFLKRTEGLCQVNAEGVQRETVYLVALRKEARILAGFKMFESAFKVDLITEYIFSMHGFVRTHFHVLLRSALVQE